MKITVIPLAGKHMIFDVEPYDQMQTLKHLIANQEGLPVAAIRLFWKGWTVQNHYTFNDYKIENESRMHLTLGNGVMWSSPINKQICTMIRTKMNFFWIIIVFRLFHCLRVWVWCEADFGLFPIYSTPSPTPFFRLFVSP